MQRSLKPLGIAACLAAVISAAILFPGTAAARVPGAAARVTVAQVQSHHTALRGRSTTAARRILSTARISTRHAGMVRYNRNSSTHGSMAVRSTAGYSSTSGASRYTTGMRYTARMRTAASVTRTGCPHMGAVRSRYGR